MIDYFLIWTGEINRDQEALAAAANDAAVAVIDIANQRFKMQSRNVTVTEATDSHAAAENEILKIELQKASVNLNFSYPEFTNPTLTLNAKVRKEAQAESVLERQVTLTLTLTLTLTRNLSLTLTWR